MSSIEPRTPSSLHDPNHPYWCAVPWCPQYVRLHLPEADTASELREALRKLANDNEYEGPVYAPAVRSIARAALAAEVGR